MKKISLVLFLQFCINSAWFSQKLNNDNILTFSLDHICYELKNPELYSVKESDDFGKIFAQSDFGKGIKRILRYDGIFVNGCMTCLYDNYGYKSEFIAPDDIQWINLNVFTDSYNKNMLSHLPAESQNEIKNSRFNQRKIFDSYLATYIKPSIYRVSDSILNFKLQSDTLEYLFKDKIDFLKIRIDTNLQTEQIVEYDYQKIKQSGLNLNVNEQEYLILYITLNFENVPNDYKVCWCSALDKKYKIKLPIRLR